MKTGKHKPSLVVGGQKLKVNKPKGGPIVIDETNENGLNEPELERPGTAKSQATNAGREPKFDDDDLFGGSIFSSSKNKKYIG